MKLKNFLLVIVLVGITACDRTDEIPTFQLANPNSFCYGDGTQSFVVTGSALRGKSPISLSLTRTSIEILSEGLTVNNLNELTGSGSILFLNFINVTDEQMLTPDIYNISNSNESKAVTGSYCLDFDPNSSSNLFVELTSGQVLISNYSTGYLIEIGSNDSNNDEFHGNYFGNVPSAP